MWRVPRGTGAADVPSFALGRMQELFGLPLWAFALVVAAFVPFAARAWGSLVERRVRQRSARLLARLDTKVAEVGVAEVGIGENGRPAHHARR